jgi:diguanylate cyclase (GGDEF)-like protein
VLLAISVSLAKPPQISKSKKNSWLFDSFINIISAFASGIVFYMAVNYLTNFSGNSVAENKIGVGSLIIAATLMAFTHFWLSLIFSTTYQKISGRFSMEDFYKRNFLWIAGTYLLGTIAALFVHFLFFNFGLGFSLIVLPMVIAAHLVYKIFMRKLAQKTKETREAGRIHLATVEALATAIDARDQVGVGHVRRTQIYAVGIGEMLNLSSDELQALNAGALLHGIGKLAVPDNILNKPGRLTPAEREKAKIHSIVGASIIESINFPYPVAPTVKHHNEMWSGNGYPDGLKGEDIPVTARVLAVADAYDTLRGERPYRPAVSREQARRILQNGAGTQFDPKIVDVFLRNLSQFEANVEEKGLSYNTDTKVIHLSEDTGNGNYVEQIKRANREVFTMYELARVFSSSLNLEETLAMFAKKIGELVPFDTCVIYLINENATFARAVYTEGKNSVALENKCVEIGEGATGYVLQKSQPVHNINPALDFSFDQLDFIEQYSAMASLPLLVDDKLLGAVSLYSCELENYGEEHLRLSEMVSHIASDAISMALQHAESETRALTDSLTGLPNARSLQIQFEKEVARASRNGGSFQLLMLDLDGFKAVNDTYGHRVGDQMLKDLARIMQDQLREYDFLARYGGDEFVIIVPETNNAGINELCERLEKAVAGFKIPIDERRIASVGVSLGASCYPTHGETIDQIIISADKRMYSVKAERKLKQTLPAVIVQPKVKATTIEIIEEENFILELDESHIISTAIN